ncbi:hypothetical protein VitviT2T_009898 [Vitis vinifera]|uniref:Uncharacterized protein n=1 Tax=Vitis vinifera TaxID=29760 RepID=A0ABY9C702_VITVI|nr:hypothetical protein VitviT2T_009898 [Vitis vinifera]
MTFVYSWPSSWLSSIILEVDASVMEGLVCTYMGNRVASLTGSEAAILARASARFAKRFYRKNPGQCLGFSILGFPPISISGPLLVSFCTLKIT